MCAIFGWSGKIDNTILRTLFLIARSWGPHAAGLCYIGEDDSQNLFKKASHRHGVTGADLLLRNHNHRVKQASLHNTGIGHTRNRTHGENTDENAHPFKYHNLCFAHNGIIYNHRQFLPDAEVDSMCLGPLLERRTPGLAHGSNGVVWLQDTELYVYRRNQHLHALSGLSPVDGKPLTVVATSPRIMQFIFGLDCVETPLNESVAYHVTPTGLVETWNDTHINDSRRYSIHTGYAVRRHDDDGCDD